jgi:hypothetical protein
MLSMRILACVAIAGEALGVVFKSARLGDAVNTGIGIAGLHQFEDLGSGLAEGNVGQTRAMRTDNDLRASEEAYLILYR